MKAMKSHENQVDDLNKQAEVIVKKSEAASVIQKDIDDFNDLWTQTFEKLCKFYNSTLIVLLNNAYCKLKMTWGHVMPI